MILAGLGMLALFVVFILVRRRGTVTETNYRSIFIIGVILLPVGIVSYFSGIESLESTGLFFQLLGIIYIILGLVNKDKWGTQHKVTNKETQVF